ncbi:MAG: TIGR04282 family arsenosugar biosynthesis glycosyltransferase [Candidatus Aureabacteria bacterium]|nr:TIGR04282 family arsenosugar biosynthesis glycosyltransferase [Candidatus Auribacterota bacterium]
MGERADLFGDRFSIIPLEKNLAMRKSNVLIVFVKYPAPGMVKTRLSRSIGAGPASRIYRYLAESVISRIEGGCYRAMLFYSPPGRGKEFRTWLGDEFEFRPQRGGDLGARLRRAFLTAFKCGAKRVVAIGTDSPSLTRRDIRAAFSMLNTRQCVIGPCLDGGYYLLGMNSLHEALFRGIDWGTEKVVVQTLAEARKIGIDCALMEQLFDVDTMEDIYRLRQAARGLRGKTASALRRLVREIDAILPQ